MPQTGITSRFIVGSYTEPYGPFRAVGDGLMLIALDHAGHMQRLDSLMLPNPSFALALDRNLVMAVLETDDDRASIARIGIEGDRLRLLHTIAAPGRIPCHLDRHPSGRWLAGACYGTGEVFTLPLDEAGHVAEGKMQVARHRGSSIHPLRQTSPHPHAVRYSPDGRWLIVPDLGTDKVMSYPLDSAGESDFSAGLAWTSPPGSGPRLPLFSANGQHLVLVEEISSMLVSLRWDNGALHENCRVSSLIAPFAGANTAAGLRWHPSGRVIGVSNRGADSIALFYFESDGGRLTPWLELPCGGKKPRDFAFSSCGRWLITSSQDSDLLALFAFDLDTGRIADTGMRLSVKSPSNLCAIPQMPGSHRCAGALMPPH